MSNFSESMLFWILGLLVLVFALILIRLQPKQENPATVSRFKQEANGKKDVSVAEHPQKLNAIELDAQIINQKQQLAETLYQSCLGLSKNQNHQDALKSVEEALLLFPDNSDYLSCAGTLAHRLSHYAKAVDYYSKALEQDLQNHGSDHERVTRAYNNLGEAWRARGEFDQAIKHYQKALARDQRKLGQMHPNVAIDLNNLGAAWESKGEISTALECYEKALEIFKRKFGSTHPHSKLVAKNINQIKAETDASTN